MADVYSDQWFKDHFGRFEAWLSAKQQQAGLPPTALITIEHAILRSYIMWRKEQDAEDHGHRAV